MKKIVIIGLILLTTAIVISAELKSFYKAKFSGLSTTVNIRLLQDDEAYDMSNFSLDEIGSIKERDVFGQYNSNASIFSSNFITGLFKHYTSDSKYFIAMAGDRVGLGSGGTFSDISNTSSSVTSGSFWTGVSFNNNFYAFNSTIGAQVYDTSHANFYTLVNRPGTNCAYSAVHKARVWAARSDSLPYRLYFSSLNRGDNWSATGGFVDLPDITQEIKGIISWGGYLYIFTETNIYVLLGSTPNDFSLRKTNSTVGTIAPRSIKITDIGICFLSRSGVYAFDGNNSNKTTSKIETTILNISKTLIQNACAIYDGRYYWLSYTPQGSSYNNIILIYDILLKDWFVYKGEACNINYFERAYGGTDKGELYGGSSTANGIIYQLQSAQGTESITHSTESAFDDGATFNTVVGITEISPEVRIKMGEHDEDTNTKLLLHFNGIDGAGVTTDSSDSDHVITFVGSTPQLDTSDKKFGSASLQVNVVPSPVGNLTIADSSDFDIFASNSDNWTVAFWVEHDSLGSTEYYLIHYLNGANFWAIHKTAGNAIEFSSVDAGTTEITANAGNIGTANQWYHIALIKVGNEYGLYVNGQQVSYNLDNDINNVNSTLWIGQNAANAFYVYGHMDEVIFQHSNIYDANPDSSLSNTIPYNKFAHDGTLTSSNIQINAADSATLGEITWVNSLPTSNTKISFQTRTGVTNDSVYWNGWQYWSSDNTVTLSTVTSSTTMFKSSNATDLVVGNPSSAQRRDVTFYEDEDVVSPNCAQFQVYGAVSKDEYADGFLTYTDLSDYNWLTIWYKSPQTGNSVEFYMGDEYSTLTNYYTTFNTVAINTWEKAYWYIGNITDSDKNGIRYIRLTYKGDDDGYIYLGDIKAHNYYDSGDTMTSSTEDWIQYRAILGSGEVEDTPKLSSITLTYTPPLAIEESTLSSYYYTKWFDFKTPQLNKTFDSLILEVNTTTVTPNLTTIYCDYDIDFGTKTGTLSFVPHTTANTVRILKNFAGSTYGKAMRLKLYNNNKDAQITVKGAEVRYREEEIQPN